MWLWIAWIITDFVIKSLKFAINQILMLHGYCHRQLLIINAKSQQGIHASRTAYKKPEKKTKRTQIEWLQTCRLFYSQTSHSFGLFMNDFDANRSVRYKTVDDGTTTKPTKFDKFHSIKTWFCFFVVWPYASIAVSQVLQPMDFVVAVIILNCYSTNAERSAFTAISVCEFISTVENKKCTQCSTMCMQMCIAICIEN